MTNFNGVVLRNLMNEAASDKDYKNYSYNHKLVKYIRSLIPGMNLSLVTKFSHVRSKSNKEVYKLAEQFATMFRGYEKILTNPEDNLELHYDARAGWRLELKCFALSRQPIDSFFNFQWRIDKHYINSYLNLSVAKFNNFFRKYNTLVAYQHQYTCVYFDTKEDGIKAINDFKAFYKKNK